MSRSGHPPRFGRALIATLHALLLHQLYAVSAPFIEIENHTAETTVHINGDAYTTRTQGRLAIPCLAGEVVKVQWSDQQTGVLCQTRLYIGL